MEEKEETVAPDVSLAEQQPSTSTGVTSVPGFQFLDEMLSTGEISQTRAAKLKASFKRISDTLKCTQDSEIQLMEEAKRCRAKLEKLQAELESTEELSTFEEPESEVSKLRHRLLQAYNELIVAEDREYKTQHKLKCLQQEKKQLEIDYPAELESQMKALNDKYEDLRKEVAERHLEVRHLREDVQMYETQKQEEQKELEEKKKMVKLKEAEKAELIHVPEEILKETQRTRSVQDAAMNRIEALNTEISKMEEQIKVVDKQNQSLRMERESIMKKLEDLRAQIKDTHMENRQLMNEQEVYREEAVELLGNRGILEMKMKNLMNDKKYLRESRSVQLQENSRQMETFRRMDQALSMATEELVHVTSVYNELQAKIDAVPKREAAVKLRMELVKEVEALKANFENKLLVVEDEGQRKQQYAVIQELLRESNHHREEVHDLRCLRHIRAEERGQKHRELLKAQQLNEHIEEELREKDLIIMDHMKLNTMLQRRISQYSDLCNMILEEKERYVALKATASQTIAELSEQIKLLENEMEIQRTTAMNKDRSLTKIQMKLSNTSKIRDKLRNDMSKIVWKQHQISQEFEDNRLELMKLTETIHLQEEAYLELNRNHETAIDRRNSLGIQLLEHEEALFNCLKRMNNQEAVIFKGNMVLETMEKDMRELKMEINEEKRQIELKKKEVLIKRKLEEEITMLQIELSEAKDKTLEALHQAGDYRPLKGEDPSTDELVEKMEQLEVNLAELDRQLLEKELLVDQVTRLSKPLGEEAENCRQDSLSLAKKLNEVRTDIVNTNHRIMAVTAELSLKQAAALFQEQQIKDKEHQMANCQERLEQGLSPYPEIEDEWRRILRDKKNRQRERKEQQRLAEENQWRQLPNGKYTTAEVRPNAYIPQNNMIPLPKPYGALAPIKPAQPGANMRHIRKPVLKPLQI